MWQQQRHEKEPATKQFQHICCTLLSKVFGVACVYFQGVCLVSILSFIPSANFIWAHITGIFDLFKMVLFFIYF